jgi:hypothetical protein
MKKIDLTQDEAIIHMQVLRREIDILESRVEPSGTGHIHTAISVLKQRLNECMMTIFTERKGW